MRKLLFLVATMGAGLTAAAVSWRRNPRAGSGLLNEVLNPVLVRRGMSGVGRSELGTLEHVGRISGTRRLTPVRPVAIGDGFRILVPLGLKSEWARNVMAAGHCRLQLHDTVYELDEPALLPARMIDELSPGARWMSGRLGFMHLRLHRFAARPGTLEPVPAGAGVPAGAEVPAEAEVPADAAAALARAGRPAAAAREP
jgi:hypothetical protein